MPFLRSAQTSALPCQIHRLADAIVLPIAPDYLIRIVDSPSRYVEIDNEDAEHSEPAMIAAGVANGPPPP